MKEAASRCGISRDDLDRLSGECMSAFIAANVMSIPIHMISLEEAASKVLSVDEFHELTSSMVKE